MAIISGMNDENLNKVTPPEGTPVISINGVLFPIGVAGSAEGSDESTGTMDANAAPEDVTQGMIFYNWEGRQVGAMPYSYLQTPAVTFDKSAKTFQVVAKASVGRMLSDNAEGSFSYNLTDLMSTISGGNTITPGTENTTINGDGYLLNNITIKGSADLVAENIKAGVTIFGVVGTYSGESSGGSGDAAVYVCANSADGSWEGYKVTVSPTDGISAASAPTALTYNGDAPSPGGMYTADALYKTVINAKYLSNVPIALELGVMPGSRIVLPLDDRVVIWDDPYEYYGDFSVTPTAIPDWLEYNEEDRAFYGTAPTTPGKSFAFAKASQSGLLPTTTSIIINVTDPSNADVSASDKLLFRLTGSGEVLTGQHIQKGTDISTAKRYVAPELTTYDGYKCYKFYSDYDWDTGETDIPVMRTQEYTGITGSSAARTVSFLACPLFSPDEEGYGTSQYGAAVNFGLGSSGRMFNVCPFYAMDEGEDDNGDWYELRRIGLCLDTYNNQYRGYIDTDWDNKIHHYAITMDESRNLRLYIDGALCGSYDNVSSGCLNTVDSLFYLGSRATSDSYQYYGYLSEVSIWGRALSASEIAAEVTRAKASAKA